MSENDAGRQAVRLQTGESVPSSVARATFPCLKGIEQAGDLTSLMALYEAHALAADPSHDLWPGTAEILRGYDLIDRSGKMHDLTRAVVLAAVTGGDNPRVEWPLGGEPAAG